MLENHIKWWFAVGIKIKIIKIEFGGAFTSPRGISLCCDKSWIFSDFDSLTNGFDRKHASLMKGKSKSIIYISLNQLLGNWQH